MKKIKTFEAACKALGLDPKTAIPDFSCYPVEDHAAMIAHCKLIIIARALNGGWKPDWSDSSQYKYFPYFNMNSGLSYGCGCNDRCSSVGSRLCFQNSELAKYAGTQFADLYKAYFTN